MGSKMKYPPLEIPSDWYHKIETYYGPSWHEFKRVGEKQGMKVRVSKKIHDPSSPWSGNSKKQVTTLFSIDSLTLNLFNRDPHAFDEFKIKTTKQRKLF